MKRSLLLLLFAVHCAFADEPDEPHFHFFTIPSQANTCFVVQSVRPWSGRGDASQYGRIQLFRSDTGIEVWRMEGVLCNANEVFPADDLKHFVIVRSHFPSRQIDSVPVVLFYAAGKLIKSYTLKELVFDMSKLRKSVSHAEFARTARATDAWIWDYPLGTEGADAAALAVDAKPNPYWRGTVLELHTLDGQKFRFEGTTGKLLEATRSH